MIAKIAQRKKGAKSSFVTLANYITKQQKLADGTAKTSRLTFTNCTALDMQNALNEIVETQKQNQTTKADKTYHLIVSFPLGERPNNKILHDIEASLVDAVGLNEHQRMSAIHCDTSYYHMHIGVNKIHPHTFAIATLKHDYNKLQQANRALEKKHNLQKLNASVGIDIKQLADELHDEIDIAMRNPTANWANVHAVFARRKLKIKPSGRGLQVVDAQGTQILKASEISRDCSRANLEKKLGPFEIDQIDNQAPISPTAERIERSAKIESFQTWAKKVLTETLPSVLDNPSARWHDIHVMLAQHGLRITTSGRGLTITDNAGKNAVKPSQISRDYSRAKLEQKIGPFEQKQSSLKVKRCQYKRTASQKHANTQSLWDEYTQLKESAKQTRKNQYAEYVRDRDDHAGQLKSEFAAARNTIWKDDLLTVATKRQIAKKLARKRQAALEKLANDNAKRRDQINASTHCPGWRDYLLDKAQAGDARAVPALRNNKSRSSQENLADDYALNRQNKQPLKEEMYNEFNDLRNRIWADNLLSAKRKYALNQYINRRQKKAMARIQGAGWHDFLQEKAQQGNLTAQVALNQEETVLQNSTTVNIELAETFLASKNKQFQVKPNGDIMPKKDVLIRNNKIHILAVSGCEAAFHIASRLYNWLRQAPQQTEKEIG